MRKQLTERDFPAELKHMSMEDMELLAVEIRDFLISNISKTGGHLSSNLGVVELSIALHACFNTPKDQIVWDVGHQSYVHKILTGRVGQFETLRKMGGMSGFPKRKESIFDVYDTGHASTSISVISGMAAARDLKGEDFETVAVIGDGALTGGLAYEGLNNLGASKSKAIVILNDNNMSIGKSTGGLSKHLGKLRVSKGYYSFKREMGKVLDGLPLLGKNIHSGLGKVRDILKYTMVNGIMFEELGFTYLGPIDGHNIPVLIENLEWAKAADGPVLLHIITKKGKGYRNAERLPDRFHGTGPFDPATGANLHPTGRTTYSEIFGRKLTELAERDSRIVAVSAAMINGTGLETFSKKFPERIFDVGIAEEHAVTFGGGLASQGMKPVIGVYSTFLQRAYDQICVDVCLQNHPVVFAVDRAGNVGADGETHHGIFDISYMSHLPNLTILAPRDGWQLEEMMEYAFSLDSPCAIRYPRGEARPLSYPIVPLSQGAQILREGKDVEIWAPGNMLRVGAEVADKLQKLGYDAGLVDPRFIKPIDEIKLKEGARRTRRIVTLEDNVEIGGFGQQVSSLLANENLSVYVIAWPDKFLEHGSVDDVYEKHGMDVETLTERIREWIEG